MGDRAPAVEAEGLEGEGAQLAEGWAQGARQPRGQGDELQGAEGGGGEGNECEWWKGEAAAVCAQEECECNG